jgi:hypothetical protein
VQAADESNCHADGDVNSNRHTNGNSDSDGNSQPDRHSHRNTYSNSSTDACCSNGFKRDQCDSQQLHRKLEQRWQCDWLPFRCVHEQFLY